jgi:sugar/nucleoside kinase (ribokinase family)
MGEDRNTETSTVTPGDRPAALFAGLCTLDVIQLVDRVPGPDEKVTSRRQVVAAGGPATNAAVTFAHLGGAATLLTGAGRHPLVAGIRADLDAAGVELRDLDPERDDPPTLPAIMVEAATGVRSVAGADTAGRVVAPPDDVPELVAAADAVQLDGHHMRVALAVAAEARRAGKPVVLDAGSWKDGTGELLALVDVAVCSAVFRAPSAGRRSPPGTRGARRAPSGDDALGYLKDRGVALAAVSRGGEPILWRGRGGQGEVAVPGIEVADTLGAGDVLHGALTFALARAVRSGRPLDDEWFAAALARAARVAAASCRSFGTRAWLEEDPPAV